MEDSVFFKTSYNWAYTIVIIIFIGSLYFIIHAINNLLGIAYIVTDFICVLAFFTKKFVFYENRIEIIKLNKLLKKRIILYKDVLKIEYMNGVVARTPPQIVIFASDESKPKPYINSFVAPSKKKTKILLKELFDRGVKIEFNCYEDEKDELKSW